MSPVVRDTLSLRRPPGFYGYAFLAIRIVEIISLIVITGIVSNLLYLTTRGDKDAPATLIAVVLFSSAALLWTLLSWTGYSRRYLPYAITWAVDLVFVVPFVIITIILGLPLDDTECTAVAANGKFEITAPPRSSFGKIVFPRDGRASCVKLFAVWGFLIAVCVLFATSALAVGFLDLGERQLNKAIFAVREESKGGAEGGYYGQDMNEPNGRGFRPTPRTQPGYAGNAVRNEEAGMDDYGYSTAPPRSSIAEDRLNLNRPVTMRPGERTAAGGVGYNEPYSQPAAARVPRQRPDDEFGPADNYRAV